MNLYFIIFIILAMASASCSPQNIITAQVKAPEIKIMSPINKEVIKDTRIVVRLNISDFELVTPDNYPRKDSGHVQVWIDDMEFRGSKTEFVFENESPGMHTIKAELMMSNNTVLPYSKTINVFVNGTKST